MEIIHAKNLINKNRIDLVVKYLYAKEFLESEYNQYPKNIYKDLYIRHILMRTKGKEDAYIDDTGPNKTSVDDYIKSFQELIISMRNTGYDNSKPVPIYNNLLRNGAHRAAAASLFNLDIPIKKAEKGVFWNFDWFHDNGFNTEDKQRILKGFIDIHSDKCTIFVVWNPLFKYIENVKAVINNYYDIVGDVELDFENNYIAFTNALLEIYDPNISKIGNETVIREKSKLLQANYLSFKVIVATNQEKNNDKSIPELSKNCKDEIRTLFNHLLPKECFCTIHSSDSEEECKYLANILLSPNNIKHLKMKISCEYELKFIQRIRNLHSFLKSLEIYDSNEICVTGSGVMTAMGIQKDSDLDFITDHKHRERLGWEVIYLNDDYDIGVSSKQAPNHIHDNIIIYNDDYHFWFKGIKFTNLEIIKNRKRFGSREKDRNHYRQMDLFDKMIGNINQQKILMERVEAEKQRRMQTVQPINSKIKYSNLLERIFSVKNQYKNDKKYKVVTILGIKIKFRRKK